MNRLILLVESRIRGDVYVRFGGELPKTTVVIRQALDA